MQPRAGRRAATPCLFFFLFLRVTEAGGPPCHWLAKLAADKKHVVDTLGDFYWGRNKTIHGSNPAAAWFTVNWEPAMRCAGDRRLGPNGDGGKWVCDPDCLLKKGQCVAFSVGSKNQFGFENSLAPFGCTVHTFDHTVTNPTPPSHVSFYKYGLDGPGGSDPQLKSLLELRDLTGVTKIDLLKIDCEGCEFEALGAPEVLEFLANSVRQILIEVHWARGQRVAVERLVLLAERLRAAGFLTFSKEPNILSRAGENIEYSLLNVRMPRT